MPGRVEQRKRGWLWPAENDDPRGGTAGVMKTSAEAEAQCAIALTPPPLPLCAAQALSGLAFWPYLPAA